MVSKKKKNEEKKRKEKSQAFQSEVEYKNNAQIVSISLSLSLSRLEGQWTSSGQSRATTSAVEDKPKPKTSLLTVGNHLRPSFWACTI